MKKLILILCIAFASDRVGYSPEYRTLTIEIKPPIRPYERVCNAVAMVESNMDDYAYNRLEQATGRWQVRPIRVRDYNEKTGDSLTLKDMYDPIKAKRVFLYYAMEIGYQNTERIIREWNGGEKGMKKRSTKKYYEKVKINLEIK